MPLSLDVLQGVAVSFRQADRLEAVRLLARYQGRERPRVQLAILALAEGDMDDVRKLVQVAREDYRDVLYWAEYPEESDTGVSRQDMARRYERMGAPIPRDLADD